MLKHYLYIFFLLVSLSCYGDDPDLNPDSLKAALHASLTDRSSGVDTGTINKINNLADGYVSSYPDSALYYSKIALAYARHANFKKGIADALLHIGAVYLIKADYLNARQNLGEAVTVYEKIHDPIGISDCDKLFGDFYYQKGEYKESLIYYNRARLLKIKINDQFGLSKVYLHIGNVYDNIGQISTGLDYYFKSLNIDLKLGKKISAAAAYNNIGLTLQNMEIYQKSLDYYSKALKTFQEAKAYGGIIAVTQNIGEIFIAQKRYREAEKYLAISLKYARRQDQKDGISIALIDMGLVSAYQKNNGVALNYLTQGEKVASEAKIDYNLDYAYIGFATAYNLAGKYYKGYEYAQKARKLSARLGSLNYKTIASLQLSIALGGLGRYSEAYQTQKEYMALKDSLKIDESVQKFTSYNLESDFKEKQQRQAFLQQERDTNYRQRLQEQVLVSAIFLLIIVGMVIIVVIYYRAKQKQTRINGQLEEKNHEILKQKTDIDQQAQKLNDLNTLKDRLISVLAHDLRAPLSTLRGLFSLLQDDTLSQQEVLEMMPQVLRRLEYTSDFLDTLLFWINSQMDNFQGTSKSFSVKDLIDNEIDNTVEHAQNKGITLINKAGPDLIAMADPDSIRIVIRNLITNAIKFSHKHDSIIISAFRHDEENLIVSVKDTGVGMPPEQLNKLFKNKVTSSIGTNNESGTGMGLLFCKDLVEKSNGVIWATSNINAGTEFFFTLPVAAIKHGQTAMAK
jgi:signal transduction histidine kinase